jgi:methylglutaconyl-CoA hydratase
MSVIARSSGALYTLLQLERRGDLLWLTMNDPKRRNALSPSMLRELTEVYAWPWRKDGVRAILLRGAGHHFCAGADLEHLRSLRDATLEDNLADSKRMRACFESILRQEALTLALVQGSCVAGGCGLATACDFVVAAEDARFLYSEAKIGFVAALVATFLPLRLRGSDVRELLLNPDFIDAHKALEIGLVNRVAAGATHAEGLAAAGEALAAEVLARASGESIARTKRVLLDLLGRPLDDALARAAQANAEARGSDDCRRGIDTFLETKQAPVWRGDS